MYEDGLGLASGASVARAGAWSLLALALVACAPADDTGSQSMDVKVDTSSELAWAQYRENLRFAATYQTTCQVGEAWWRPRVLVTGFGRFQSQRVNATGMVVSELLDGLDYPLTEPPPAGQIDPPAPQTAVAVGTIVLDGIGEVDVCAMVLPVFWDLASVLVLKEIDAFLPDVVIMNGVAGSRQPLWLELGAVNRATALEDGSGILQPIEEGAPLIPTAGDEDYARGNLASWPSLRHATEQAIATLSESPRQDGTPLGDIVDGVRFAGYPRASNTYLCNNTTYTVGYLMDHGGERLDLLQASEPREGEPSSVPVELEWDHSSVPRWFVHWPSDLKDAHVAAGAQILRAMMTAQLEGLWDVEAQPSRGDNALADL